MAIHSVINPRTLTFYVGTDSYSVDREHPSFDKIVQALNYGDAEKAIDLSKPIQAVAKSVTQALETSGFRRRAGKLLVSYDSVTYEGEPLHGHMIDRLLDTLRAGLDISSWVRFIENLMQNPSKQARNELYLWLEKSEMPITSDGHFLAYKRVRNNYKDIHSGRFDNSVGQVVSMDRTDVDDDRRRTCSTGLHFCSKSYLPHFGSWTSGDRVMVVKINPADVVAIPADYNDAKGRTWRYEVVDEVTEEFAHTRSYAPVYEDYDDEEDDDFFDDEWNDDDYEDDEDDNRPATREEIRQVFGWYRNAWDVVRGSETGDARELRLLRISRVLGREIHSFNDLTKGDLALFGLS